MMMRSEESKVVMDSFIVRLEKEYWDRGSSERPGLVYMYIEEKNEYSMQYYKKIIIIKKERK